MDEQHRPDELGDAPDEFEAAASRSSKRKDKKTKGRDYSAEYERRKARKAASDTGEPEPEKPRRGRPPGSGRKAAASSEPIDPKHVAGMLGFFANMIATRIGVTPLSAAEIEEGGKALAPVVDHYLPTLVQKIGPWGPAIYWGTLVITPRIIEYTERRAAIAQAAADAKGEPDQGPRFRDAPTMEGEDAAGPDVDVEAFRRPAFAVGPVGGLP